MHGALETTRTLAKYLLALCAPATIRLNRRRRNGPYSFRVAVIVLFFVVVTVFVVASLIIVFFVGFFSSEDTGSQKAIRHL